MKYVLMFAFIVSLVVPSGAQADCDRTIADLPAIHGLRLGTSRREVERAYKITPASIVAAAPNKLNLGRLEGIWFDFYQDSLSNIEFDYVHETEWTNVREFAAVFERSLKLPTDSWVFIDRTEAVMKCQGFNVAISSVRNTFALTDTFARTSPGIVPLARRMRIHGR